MSNNVPHIVSFFSDPKGETYYSAHAKRMHAQLTSLGINSFEIHELGTTDSWVGNTRLKPQFILDMLEKHKRDILWLDVDSNVCKAPAYKWDLSCDFAAPKFNEKSLIKPPLKIRSIAMWFNYTERTIKLVNDWVKSCSVDDGESSDHRAISNLLYDDTIKMDFMPNTYADKRQKNDTVIAMGLSTTVKSRRKHMQMIHRKYA